jgi:Flp pilus assembly protein TadD
MDNNNCATEGTALDNLCYTGALISLDKALAIDPKDEDALYNKGVVLDNLGSLAEAILYYDKALAVQPNDTYPLTGKGDALED